MIKYVLKTINNSNPIEYIQKGKQNVGYYNQQLQIFVGEVKSNGIITTVIDKVTPQYIQNLLKRKNNMKKSKNINYTYDSEADAVYIYLEDIQQGGVAKTITAEDSGAYEMVNLDYDKDGKLVGVEILGLKNSKDKKFID